MRLLELERFKKVDLIRELYTCSRCGFCRSVCPIYAEIGWEGASPRGKIYYTRKLLEGGAKIDPQYVKRVFQCLFCDQCDIVCQQSIKHTFLWKAMRAELGRRGLWPKPVKEISASIKAEKNPYGLPNVERIDWAWDVEDLVMPRLNKNAKVAYFVGCVSSFSPRASSIAESMVRILESVHIDYTVLGSNEWCCGDPFLLCILEPGGYRLAGELVRHNVEKLHELGVEVLVASCAGCYRTLKIEYPEVYGKDLEFEVLSESEFLERLIDEGKLKLTKGFEKVVTYHDPCELGRHGSGIFEAPRKVLENVPKLKFNELLKNRKNCRCCGGGGLVKATNPQLAVKIAFEKLNEAHEVGADVIASCCPACKINIRDAVVERRDSLQVLDLAEVVASVL